MINWISETFNNREIASAIWLSIFIAYCTLKLDIGTFLKEIVKIFFGSALVFIFAGLAIWTTLGIYALNWTGLWTFADLKLSIFWFLFSGAAFLGSSIQNNEGMRFFRRAIFDQFKIIALLEFMVVFYSFTLVTELLFVPAITFLTLLLAVSESKEEYGSVKKLVEWVLALVALFLTYNFVSQTISNVGVFWAGSTLREIIVPFLLSLFALPYGYIFNCHSRWQEAGHRIDQKTYHSDDLRSYARRRFFLHFYLRPTLLKRAVRQFNMLPVNSKKDITGIIDDVKKYETLRKSPPKVARCEGWTPYAIESVLGDQGFQMDDFHELGFDNEWGAGSNTIYVDQLKLFEPVTVRASGCQGIVRAVSLSGRFKNGPRTSDGFKQFERFCTVLLERLSTIEKLPEEISDAFENLSNASRELEDYQITLDVERYEFSDELQLAFTVCPLTQ